MAVSEEITRISRAVGRHGHHTANFNRTIYGEILVQVSGNTIHCIGGSTWFLEEYSFINFIDTNEAPDSLRANAGNP
ncbi:hypothetical protein WG66_008102 [Moniliophthora roreri]|nr:hypothetical protein WG66_008102 [Moniliophthora roreri]